jgi:serine protease Do
MHRLLPLSLSAALSSFAGTLPAQTPGPVPEAPAAGGSAGAVDDEQLELRITETCDRLRQQDKLPQFAMLQQQGRERRHCELQLSPPRTAPQSAPQLYDLARPSSLIVGHYYKCPDCDDWHFTGASGFALTKDGAVATCAHLLDDDPDMPTAFLVVADYDGRVWPVQQVLAADHDTDVCILKIERPDQVPLSLRADVRTGESIWLLSNPDHQFASFAQGMVARWYRWRDEEPQPAVAHKLRPAPAKAPAPLWLHVTTAFGKGSSGGPVLDACGNAVGLAQSTVTMVYDDAQDKPDVQMVLYTASPAQALQALVQSPATK